ncbi:gluconokinase, partial [Priestia megaterium]|uniref:gluconokinase n=1 Tax=Priestia megaterium TaxID=1404 RepID=UPI002FFEE71E
MLRELVIGLDIGTTSVKAVIFNLKGKLIGEAEKLITFHYPQSGWVEQDPYEIERSAILAIKAVIEKADVKKNELLGIGVSCAMHSLICVDEGGGPLSNALIWADGRSSEQAEKLMQTEGINIYLKTGVPIHPMTPLAKLLWMKEVEYKPFYKAKYFMSVKEFLIHKWFNERVVDYSMAAGTGLFNSKTLQWNEGTLKLVQVDKEQLSRIVPPTEILRGINKNIAEEMGISSQLPFVLGAADGQLANLGIGAISPGEVAITIGTSGAIRQFIRGFEVSDKHETFCYRFTEEYSIIGGPTNNGGIVLNWIKGLLGPQDSYDELLLEAKKVKPGAEGILFLPYVNGERAPVWNQKAKGNFYGLSISHKKEHFVRAVIEGINFNIYQIGKSLEKLAGEPQKIYVNGGVSKSPVWIQIMADIFGKEIHVAKTHHSAAWGAAWTALLAIDKVGSFEEIKENLPMGKVIIPNEDNHKIY